jgi:hypothetical protein
MVYMGKKWDTLELYMRSPYHVSNQGAKLVTAANVYILINHTSHEQF